MAKVFTVLNVGGGFLPKHAQVLQKQVLQWSPPGTEFICLKQSGSSRRTDDAAVLKRGGRVFGRRWNCSIPKLKTIFCSWI